MSALDPQAKLQQADAVHEVRCPRDPNQRGDGLHAQRLEGRRWRNDTNGAAPIRRSVEVVPGGGYSSSTKSGSRPSPVTVNPRVRTYSPTVASPAALSSLRNSAGQRRYRSCSRPRALRVGGTARLQSTSTVTGPSEGSTLARTKSGPISNSGFGRLAKKTWALAVTGHHASATARSSRAATARTRGTGLPASGAPGRERCVADRRHPPSAGRTSPASTSIVSRIAG